MSPIESRRFFWQKLSKAGVHQLRIRIGGQDASVQSDLHLSKARVNDDPEPRIFECKVAA